MYIVIFFNFPNKLHSLQKKKKMVSTPVKHKYNLWSNTFANFPVVSPGPTLVVPIVNDSKASFSNDDFIDVVLDPFMGKCVSIYWPNWINGIQVLLLVTLWVMKLNHYPVIKLSTGTVNTIHFIMAQ